MIKRYTVTQTVFIGGQKITSNFSLEMTEDDCKKFLSLLDGGYEVREVNLELSNYVDMNKTVSSVSSAKKINIYCNGSKGSLYSSINSYKGSINFKKGVDSKQIMSVLSGTTPFSLSPSSHPESITVKWVSSV